MRVHQTSLGLSHQTRLFGESQGKLLLVADGLGGHESGERASTLAVDGVTNYILNAMDCFTRLNQDREAEFEAELMEAFRHSQAVLEAEADAIPQRRGMATTLTMAYIDWPKLYVVHVGDTRCYHVHENTIKCLTTDHTFGELTKAALESVGETVDEQDTKPHHPMQNALWNVIGGRETSLEPEITRAELAVGDSLLLCSDGLTRYLPEEQLLGAVTEDCSSKEICEQFIEKANALGGRDNITAVVAKFKTSPSNEADACEVGELTALSDTHL